MTGVTEESEEVSEQEPPAQTDPSGRWTRTNYVLGKGAFKTVYKGFDEQEGLEVAWNQIRMNELVSTKEDRERLFAEIRVLKQLKHKNIMSFYDSWLENKGYTVNFITELFTSGTLRQYRKRHKHMEAEVMKRWAWQILCGLVYLHGHTPPIIHRDLKCDNIFINGSEGVVKIGDLGLATMLRARTAPQSVLGTPEFMAPELYDEEYDDRVDVYSFGMCLLELATLEYPYSECRNAAQIYRKVTLGVRPKALSRLASKELAEFVSYCIQPRAERPRSRQLLKHTYFDSIRTERCSLKLSAEALGLPIPETATHNELVDYANSAGSSSVSRTSSAAGELHTESAMLLDAVPEEEESAGTPDSDTLAPGRVAPEHAPPQIEDAEQARFLRPGKQEFSKSDSLREFKVKGRLQEEEDKLNLRLRILQPDRALRVVEFDFDLSSDTAISVASEMVEEMSLSHNDAHKIALAIKEEIFNLTQKAREAGSRAATEHTSRSGHSSDDEGHVRRHTVSDSGAAEQTVVATMEPSALGAASRHNDSANSVCDTTSRESPLSPLRGHAQPALRPALSGVAAYLTSSPPDSHMSFGSSPAGEPMAIDPPPPLRPPSLALGGGARKPPAAPVSLARSESALPRHGSHNVFDHAAEVESLQTALSNERAGDRVLFAPPKEEDRRLPLKKLLENLQEVECGTAATMPLPSIRSEPLGFFPNGGSITPRSVNLPVSQSVGSFAAAANNRPPDLRRMSYDAAGMGSPASTSGRHSETSTGPTPFSGQPMQASRTSSPRQDGAGDGGASRPKETAEAKEARRQAAQTSLKNMESKSLEGLGTFGVSSRSCKQVPIKMMGLGRSGS